MCHVPDLLQVWTNAALTIAANVRAVQLVDKWVTWRPSIPKRFVFHRFSIMDPRNLVTHVSTWTTASGPLHMPPTLRNKWEV